MVTVDQYIKTVCYTDTDILDYALTYFKFDSALFIVIIDIT